MIYYNIKPIFVLDSTKITELKLDAVSKRLALKTKQTNLNRTNFDILINEVKTSPLIHPNRTSFF